MNGIFFSSLEEINTALEAVKWNQDESETREVCIEHLGLAASGLKAIYDIQGTETASEMTVATEILSDHADVIFKALQKRLPHATDIQHYRLIERLLDKFDSAQKAS